MNKELIVTSEDIELLKEMKDNCLKSDVYDDEKRLLKANAITKVLYENEKNKHYKTLYQSLKKQKEELEEENFNLRENIYIEKMSFSSEGRNIKELIEMPTYEDLLNQQKEFIDYLEDLIKQNETVVEVSKYGLPKNCSKLLIDFYKEILSKYKEIIGGKEKNNKHIATLN